MELSITLPDEYRDFFFSLLAIFITVLVWFVVYCFGRPFLPDREPQEFLVYNSRYEITVTDQGTRRVERSKKWVNGPAGGTREGVLR